MSLLSLQTITGTADLVLGFFIKEFKTLTANEFRSRLRENKRAKLIDISTREEFYELHIPGSINYDVLSPGFVDNLEKMDRLRPYFIYCRNGKRSESAMRLMDELGFRKVYSLSSGLQSWMGTVERSY